MPGVGGVQHVVGKAAGKFGETLAVGAEFSFDLFRQGDAVALEGFEAVVDDFLLRSAKARVFVAHLQRAHRLVEAVMLGEVGAVGGQFGQDFFVSGAPFVAALHTVQVADGRDGLAEAVRHTFQRLHQGIPGWRGQRREAFRFGAVFFDDGEDSIDMFGLDTGEIGRGRRVIERVLAEIGHGVSCG